MVSSLHVIIICVAFLLHSIDAQSVKLVHMLSSSGEECPTLSTGSSVTLLLNITVSTSRWTLNLKINTVTVSEIQVRNNLIALQSISSVYSNRFFMSLSTTTISNQDEPFTSTIILSRLQSNDTGLIFTGIGSGSPPASFTSDPLDITACSFSGNGVMTSCSSVDPCVYNSTTELFCMDGFSSSTSTPVSTRCGACTSFDSTLNCTMVKCNTSSIKDNSLVLHPPVDAVNVSEVVNITCAQGYTGIGASYSCGLDGNFNLIEGSSDCSIVTCNTTLVHEEYLRLDDPVISVNFSDSVNFNCSSKYIGTGAVFTCNSFGGWNQTSEINCNKQTAPGVCWWCILLIVLGCILFVIGVIIIIWTIGFCCTSFTECCQNNDNPFRSKVQAIVCIFVGVELIILGIALLVSWNNCNNNFPVWAIVCICVVAVLFLLALAYIIWEKKNKSSKKVQSKNAASSNGINEMQSSNNKKVST